MQEIVLDESAYIGGCGYPVSAGDSVKISFGENALAVRLSNGASFLVRYFELASLDVAGPGTQKTAGGFIGGGFGAEGAIEGMAIATVLNALTTRSKIHTFVSITTNIGELHFHYGRMEPSALRVALAPVYAALRRLDPTWRKERLAALELAQAGGAFSEPEFTHLSKRLSELTKEELVPPPAAAESPAVRRTDAHLTKARAMRGVGFDRATVADQLRLVGLAPSDIEHILQAVFRDPA